MLVTADSTNVILLPEENSSWNNGLHRLKLTYHCNHGDEALAQDHRYDRAVIYPEGDQSVLLELQI